MKRKVRVGSTAVADLYLVLLDSRPRTSRCQEAKVVGLKKVPRY